ncbi:hypothetical protein T265_09746 [Opisthorchis viverrini]|uniref:Uncharacterized protein n=1 Tax=Opisthorchis viverrini TaxID=6198 RepID=A0A075A3Y2_OPIVI|nr:hypothetical protein T265_09746 [Opisthorchis viverrini]KER22094.1 hypothetical protein T265_09746 [Opisthorchis viverrini]
MKRDVSTVRPRWKRQSLLETQGNCFNSPVKRKERSKTVQRNNEEISEPITSLDVEHDSSVKILLAAYTPAKTQPNARLLWTVNLNPLTVSEVYSLSAAALLEK